MKQRQPLIHLPTYGNGDFETVAAFFLFILLYTSLCAVSGKSHALWWEKKLHLNQKGSVK